MYKNKLIDKIIKQLKELKKNEQAKGNITERELNYIERQIVIWQKEV